MKKFILKTLAALFLATAVSSAYALDAVVLSTKGKTEVLKNEKWTPLKEGSTLAKGDVVQTGFKSNLKLKIGASTVEVAPMTRITIEQLVSKKTKDETSLYLDTGSVKSNVNKVDKRKVGFTVRSPAATASVRGTVVGVTTGYRTSTVKTESGKVYTTPTTTKKPVVATAEQDAAPETASDFGNAPADSNGTKKGHFVNAGQTSSISSTGKVTAPQAKAKEAAVSTGAAPTVTVVTAPSTPAAPVTGSLKVNVIVED